MRVLVTGGSGFVGSHLASALVRAGHRVAVLDDSSRGTAANLADVDVETVTGDVRDAATVRRACAGADVVAHLAAVQGTGNFYRAPARVLDVNVGGTLEIVRAASAAGVRRVVFASSSEIYATPPVVPTPEEVPAVIPDVRNPRFSYSGSKIVGELLVLHFAQAAGFEPTIVRYHNVYGPRMGWDHVIPQFVMRLERGEPFTVQGDGSQTRAFCYVTDAIDATVRACTLDGAAGGIFNIGNDEREWTINELIGLLAEVSGKRIVPQYGPPAMGGTPRRLPDIARARELLEYAPRVTLREGLAATYEWYRDEIRRGGGPARA